MIPPHLPSPLLFVSFVTVWQSAARIVAAPQSTDTTMRQITALAIAAFALSTALPANAAPAATSPIVIAQPVDLSSPGADFGRDFSLGAKIYFDYVNLSGGIKGRKIVYRQSDTAGQTRETIEKAQQMLSEHTDILFGVAGDSAIEKIATSEQRRNANVALFAAIAGKSSLGSKDGVFHLRAGLSDEIHAITVQLKNLGISTFGLASTPDSTEEALAAFNSEAEKQGIRLVAKAKLSGAVSNDDAAADTILKAHPQAVIVVGDTLTAARFFKRYRDSDPGAFLCSPSIVNVKTLVAAIGPKAARGLIISQVVPDPAAILDITREHKRLMEKFVDEPASQGTLEGFIAAKMLVATLQKAPDATANSLHQTLTGGKSIDLGGYVLDGHKGGRMSRFVELSVVGRDGRLVR